MKKLILMLILCFGCGSGQSYLEHKARNYQRYTPNIKWEEFKRDKKTEKLTLFYFGAQDCGPCKEFEKENFTKLNIINVINKYFYPVKLDEESALYSRVQAKYDLKYTPSVVVVREDGSQLLVLEGYRDSKSFGEFLQLAVLMNALEKVQQLQIDQKGK